MNIKQLFSFSIHRKENNAVELQNKQYLETLEQHRKKYGKKETKGTSEEACKKTKVASEEGNQAQATLGVSKKQTVLLKEDGLFFVWYAVFHVVS